MAEGEAIRVEDLEGFDQARARGVEVALRIRGRAPHELVYALGPEPAERYRSGDVRIAANTAPSRSHNSDSRRVRSSV